MHVSSLWGNTKISWTEGLDSGDIRRCDVGKELSPCMEQNGAGTASEFSAYFLDEEKIRVWG
jgi:hypothetical protein